uniref:HTH_Tnp_Tc3_1 domain-containing protein n=1 Tax=Steinernema glaseri TaxID=37863 RepID=A0A1I8ADN5_9BILA
MNFTSLRRIKIAHQYDMATTSNQWNKYGQKQLALHQRTSKTLMEADVKDALCAEHLSAALVNMWKSTQRLQNGKKEKKSCKYNRDPKTPIRLGNHSKKVIARNEWQIRAEKCTLERALGYPKDRVH